MMCLMREKYMSILDDYELLGCLMKCKIDLMQYVALYMTLMMCERRVNFLSRVMLRYLIWLVQVICLLDRVIFGGGAVWLKKRKA